ncbi:MAG: hypothetical protein RLZZ416_494 [Candidatus Parcubacteria bacterium]|jgi:hypothetical protein
MSWASRRRFLYASGVTLFFLAVIGGPISYWYFSIPATCFDGVQNQDETGVDVGGSCPILDPGTLQQATLIWSRAFKVRDGTYTAAAYVENPNKDAGVEAVPYHFGLYDAYNVLIAERRGLMFIMPGSITPVVESRIDVGSRTVSHTYFNFSAPLVWRRMQNTALGLSISNKQLTDVDTQPRLTAIAVNSSVADVVNPSFVAAIFDPAGNVFAVSHTRLDRIEAGKSAQIIFTWPGAFGIQVGRSDIIPIVAPADAPAAIR